MKTSICVETQQGASYEQLLALAEAAEQHGFAGFYCSDHYMKMPWKPGAETPGPSDAWTTLAGLARETGTIQLGTLVNSATFRQPVPLAIIVAQVDQMSGGRAALGLGAGWFVEEHTAQGIPFPPLAERFDRLEEQLAIITGFWNAEARFHFVGRHYRVVDSPALPKPAQHPAPPIIIGGNGPRRTPALAARYAAEFNAPFVSPLATKKLFDRVRRACEEIERDPSTLALSAGLIICCGEDAAEVGRRAAVIGIDPNAPGDGMVCGTPAEVVDRLATWGGAGASHLYLEIGDLTDFEHLALLAAEVLPQLE